MKQIIKFQDNANKALVKFWTIIKRMFVKIIPLKVQTIIKRKYSEQQTKLNKLSSKFQNQLIQIPDKIEKAKEKTLEIKEKVSLTTQNAKDKIKSFDIKSVNKKAVVGFLVALFSPFLYKVKIWYTSLRPETFAAYLVAGMITTFGGFNIYKSSKEIIDKSKTKKIVKIEKIEDANSPARRPAYFNNVKKQFSINNVTLPVYIETTNSVRSLVIDFQIESSNRYITQYFLKHDYLIKDKLNKTIQPIIPDFPLTLEGKIIIKEKVKKELNLLLKDLKVEGEIISVNFEHIISG